ncbi:NACHT domain-containing protein [Triangularia setosa]|uniref:NACHT domain-containing protein n=1 Tax=Triangularia setosa TaxID=2587417 RepID=A0AAN7A882_9PEZI|nr:NACHT domain-containing protein [Podospora setosa]
MAHGDDQRLLWIKGNPGKGKTMLLCGIIDELEVSTPTSLLSFFFCQATDPRINSATAVLRGLIYILIKQQPALISYVRQHYDPAGERGFEDPNTWVVLREILTNILKDPVVRIAYLFIDALDECVTDLPQLLKLIVEMSSTSFLVKWIVSSRNWTQIEEELEMAAQNARLSLELNAKSVTAAVNAYIYHKVDDLSRRKKYDTATKSEVQNYLSSNANGTFLWVALVCKALTDVPKWHTKGKLKTFPPGLDSLYRQMMGQIQNSEDADLCRDILAVAATVRRPISLDEITSLVRMPDGISDDRRSLEEIISLCGSFLTIRKQTVYFIHQSAKDFLSGEVSNNNNYQDAFKWVFHAGKEKVNHDIFSKSLHVMFTALRRDIYGLKAPGISINQVSMPNPDPLASVRYSCIYWIDHLCDLISSTNSTWVHLLQDNGDVQKFLTTKYLYWLEALSLLGALSNGINAVRQLQGLQGSNNDGQLKVIIQDAHRFAQSYGQIIQRAPLQVYLSALVFAPIGSLFIVASHVFKSSAESPKPGWLVTGSVVEMQWNACTQTLEGHRSSVGSVAFSPDG